MIRNLLKKLLRRLFIIVYGLRCADKLSDKLRIIVHAGLHIVIGQLLKGHHYRIVIFLHNIRRHIGMSKVKVDNIIFYLPDHVSFYVLLPDYEKYMYKYLCSLKEGDIFVDLGAHIGKYTFLASKLVGKSGLVIAVEPNIENYIALIKGIAENEFNNIIALNIAAWNKGEIHDLFLGWGSSLHSIAEKQKLGRYKVQCRRMDEVLEELNVSRVNLIKMDIEGSEAKALRGLMKTLRASRPRLVIEVRKRNLTKVRNFMNSLGYTIKHIEDDNYYCEYQG